MQHLQKSAILGVVGGGYNDDMRCRSAKETAKRPVQGIGSCVAAYVISFYYLLTVYGFSLNGVCEHACTQD